jgi:hypothetical protein
MIDALRHWRQPWAKNIFWLFCIFFGYAFIISQDFEGGADSARYAHALTEYRNSEMDIRLLFKTFYSESSSNIDIAQPVFTFLVSRITADPHILFAVFAAIFGFFHSRNIWLILSKLNSNTDLVIVLFLFVFVLLNPIWFINGFRMWTAAQIFIYGTLHFIYERKTKMLIWPVISTLFHFSFMIPLVVLLVFLLLKNRITIYITLFILTSFIKEIDLQLVRSYLSLLPSVVYSRVIGYTNIEHIESVAMAAGELNWYLPLASKSLSWVIYLFTLYIFFFCRGFLKEHKTLMSLFCFSTFFYSIGNLMISLVPTGGRFILVSSTLMFAFLTIFLSFYKDSAGVRIIKMVSIPLLVLYCIVNFRIGMDYFGLTILIGNPLFVGLGTESSPLIEGIKRLI